MATVSITDLNQTGGKLYNYTNDARVREYLTAIADAFDSLGFERTADTGQFDPETLNKPGTSDEIYEIRKFTGTYHDSAPIYVKLHWNYDGSASGLSISVGTGSNGSGTITNKWVNTNNLTSSSTPVTGGKVLISGEAGKWIAFYDHGAAESNSRLFIIGRTVNSSGEITNDGAFFLDNGTTLASYYFDGDTAYTGGGTYYRFAYAPCGNTTSPKPAEVVLFPRIWGQINGPAPLQHGLTGFTSEHAALSTVSLVNVGDAEINYKATYLTTGDGLRIFMRWD